MDAVELDYSPCGACNERRPHTAAEWNEHHNFACTACFERRVHTAAEWSEFHPYAGHGYAAGSGWSHKELEAVAKLDGRKAGMIVDVRTNPGESRKYRAFLDGVDVSGRCFYADDEAGEVRLFKRDAMGHLIYDFATNAPAEEILHGQVRIVRRSD